MAAAANDRRDEQRQEARIKIRFADAESFEKEWVTNISKGGMFINTKKPHPMRSKLRFVITLPVTNEIIELMAEVVHVTEAKPGMDPATAGIGVQFTDITSARKAQIEKFIAKIKSGEEIDAPDIPPKNECAPGGVKPTNLLFEALQRASVETQELTPQQLSDLKRKIKVFYAQKAEKNHYDLLGVRYTASAEAIREAYHKLSMDFHPDRHHNRLPPDLRPQMEDIFGRINKAYKTLRDVNMRLEYDVAVGNFASVPNMPELSEEAKRNFQKNKQYQIMFPEKVARAADMLKEAKKALAANDKATAEKQLRIAFSFNPFNWEITKMLADMGIKIKPPEKPAA